MRHRSHHTVALDRMPNSRRRIASIPGEALLTPVLTWYTCMPVLGARCEVRVSHYGSSRDGAWVDGPVVPRLLSSGLDRPPERPGRQHSGRTSSAKINTAAFSLILSAGTVFTLVPGVAVALATGAWS